jgi:chromosome segregation ATPase
LNNDDGNPADVFDTEESHPGHGGGGNGGNSLLPNPIEPRSTFLRPWARRPDPNLEQLRSAVGALGELMTGIRDNLENNARRQDEMLQYLSHLPQALQQLPESARVQGEALKAIQLRMERQSIEQQHLVEILERISTADQVNGRTLEGLQQRVDTLNQHDKAIAENLNEVGEAMQSLGRHSETSALVLKQMREDTSTRNGELERILHRQGSRFTTMLAVAIFLSIAALAAVGVIGYLLLNPPVK